MSDDSDFFNSILKSKANKLKKSSSETGKSNIFNLDDDFQHNKRLKSDSSDEFFTKYFPSVKEKSDSSGEEMRHKSEQKSCVSSVKSATTYNRRRSSKFNQNDETWKTGDDVPQAKLENVNTEFSPLKAISGQSTFPNKSSSQYDGGQSVSYQSVSREVNFLNDEFKKMQNSNEFMIASNNINSEAVRNLSQQSTDLRDQMKLTQEKLDKIYNMFVEFKESNSSSQKQDQNERGDEIMKIVTRLERNIAETRKEIMAQNTQIESIQIPKYENMIDGIILQIKEELQKLVIDNNLKNCHVFLRRVEDLESLIKSCLSAKTPSCGTESLSKGEVTRIMDLLGEISGKLCHTVDKLNKHQSQWNMNDLRDFMTSQFDRLEDRTPQCGWGDSSGKLLGGSLLNYSWLAESMVKEQQRKYSEIKKKVNKDHVPVNIRPVRVEDMVKYHTDVSTEVDRMGTLMRLRNATATAKSYLQSEDIFLSSL